MTKDKLPNQEEITCLSEIRAGYSCFDEKEEPFYRALSKGIEALRAQPERLTDKEQRIFLAAMSREEKVCEEVDRNYVREPYEDSLMRVCKEIRRKVKGALWTM